MAMEVTEERAMDLTLIVGGDPFLIVGGDEFEFIGIVFLVVFDEHLTGDFEGVGEDFFLSTFDSPVIDGGSSTATFLV